MSKQIRTLIALVSVPFALAAGAAHASDTTTCVGEVSVVKDAITAGVFTNAINQTNLLLKVDAARAKLDLNKPSDAVDLLIAVSDKATELATATKPKLADATGINATASTAVACIGLAG